jgi:hypothetical protein
MARATETPREAANREWEETHGTVTSLLAALTRIENTSKPVTRMPRSRRSPAPAKRLLAWLVRLSDPWSVLRLLATLADDDWSAGMSLVGLRRLSV